jgi:hypothetical protein
MNQAPNAQGPLTPALSHKAYLGEILLGPPLEKEGPQSSLYERGPRAARGIL